jgi:chemotaxis protein MotB
MKEEEPKKKGGGAPDWMVTFSDLMTLLLTFFVLLLSTAEISKPKFEKAVASLQSALAGINLIGDPVSSFQPVTLPNPSFKEQNENESGEEAPPNVEEGKSDSEEMQQSDMIYEQLLSELDEQLSKGLLEMEKDNEKILIRFPSDVTFESGSARLSKPAVSMIRDVGSILSGFYVDMKASGYTDSIPIRSGKFRSNHELSSSRAVSVVQELKQSGSFAPEELTVVGHGEGFPLAPNSTPEGRMMNRRVELEINPSTAKLSEDDLENFGKLDSLKGIQKAGEPLQIDMSQAKQANNPAMQGSDNTTLDIFSTDEDIDVDRKLREVIGGNEVSKNESETDPSSSESRQLRNTGSRRTVFISTDNEDNSKRAKVFSPNQLTGRIDSMNKGKYRIKRKND